MHYLGDRNHANYAPTAKKMTLLNIENPPQDRVGALEAEVQLLKTTLRDVLKKVGAIPPIKDWREHIKKFDPDAHGEIPWEEMLVSLGVLFGAQLEGDIDQVKKTLARIVSIAEFGCGKTISPLSQREDFVFDARALYIHFPPEGSDREAVDEDWEWAEVGGLAASWLRSFYA